MLENQTTSSLEPITNFNFNEYDSELALSINRIEDIIYEISKSLSVITNSYLKDAIDIPKEGTVHGPVTIPSLSQRLINNFNKLQTVESRLLTIQQTVQSFFKF